VPLDSHSLATKYYYTLDYIVLLVLLLWGRKGSGIVFWAVFFCLIPRKWGLLQDAVGVLHQTTCRSFTYILINHITIIVIILIINIGRTYSYRLTIYTSFVCSTKSSAWFFQLDDITITTIPVFSLSSPLEVVLHLYYRYYDYQL